MVGFRDVDGSGRAAQMVQGMDAIGARPEVLRLRAWEADRLGLRRGNVLLDVGCGTGIAAIALAPAVGPEGRVIGIDPSETMISACTERAAALQHCEFRIGDATALELPDASVDAYRSERTYQWLAAPEQAWAEALRVLRPAGRVCVIDSDWGTRVLHLNEDTDPLDGFRPPLVPNPHSGRRLLNQARAAGFVDLDMSAETLLYTHWDPDTEPGVAGFIPFDVLAGQLVERDALTQDDASAWLSTLHEAGRCGTFFMAMTMFAVAGSKPAPRAVSA